MKKFSFFAFAAEACRLYYANPAAVCQEEKCHLPTGRFAIDIIRRFRYNKGNFVCKKAGVRRPVRGAQPGKVEGYVPISCFSG